jgi:CRP-like cAMP-binding protein
MSDSDQKTGEAPPVPRNRSQTLDGLWADVQQLIAGSHLFRSLDDAGRKALLERGRIMLVPAGTVIVTEGEQGDSFFVIDQGVVEVVTSSPSGGDVSLTTLQRGAFFGEVSVLTDAPRTATVTALTNVAAVAFSKADVDELLSSNPKAKRLLEAVMTGRARDTAEKVAKASTMPPPDEESE